MATQSRCQVEHCYGRLTEQGQDTVKVIYKLYERYVRHIARSTRHLTPEELEEVAQEVFLAVGLCLCVSLYAGRNAHCNACAFAQAQKTESGNHHAQARKEATALFPSHGPGCGPRHRRRNLRTESGVSLRKL